MPAYIVFSRLHTRNPAELKKYAEQAPVFLAGHRLQFLARFGACAVMEGPGVESVAILEFPTMAEARAWYASPVYQEACRHRFLGGDYSVVMVEGVDAAPAH